MKMDDLGVPPFMESSIYQLLIQDLLTPSFDFFSKDGQVAEVFG